MSTIENIKICPFCGKENQESFKFCHNCGHNLLSIPESSKNSDAKFLEKNQKEEGDEKESKPNTKVNKKKSRNTYIPLKRFSINKIKLIQIWISFILIIVTIIILYFSCHLLYLEPLDGFSDAIANLIVQSFFILIISYFIHLYIKKKRLITYFLVFSILFAMVALYNSSKNLYKYYITNNLVNYFSSAIQDITYNKPKNSEMEFSKLKYGEFAPLLKIFNKYMIKFNKIYSEYYKQIESQNLGNILSKSTIENRSGLQNGFKTLDIFTEKLNKFERTILTTFDEYNYSIHNNDLDESIIFYFDQRFNNNKDKIFAFINIEREIISTLYDILEHCQQSIGTYYFIDENIYFTDNYNLNKYNKLNQKLWELIDTEQYFLQKFSDSRNIFNDQIQSLKK